MKIPRWILRLFGRKPTQVVRGSGFITPDGMGAMFSTHNPKPLPEANDRIEVIWTSLRTQLYECGHRAPRGFQLSIFGEEMKRVIRGKRCPDCLMGALREAAIHCAVCGLSILPGEGVALYAASQSAGLRFFDFGKRVGDSVLGCMRWDCCPSGAFFGGHWTGDEFKSAFDGRSMSDEVMRTGQPIIGNL